MNVNDCGCGGNRHVKEEPRPGFPVRLECVRTSEVCQIGNKKGHIYKCGNQRICIPDELGLVAGDIIQLHPPCDLVNVSVIRMQTRERAEGVVALVDAPPPVMYILTDAQPSN